MQDFFDTFGQQLAATSGLEWLAVLLALSYVFLAARQHSACWPSAFFSTAIYTYLFWQVTLPFQAGLNVFYMLMAVYGWWQWGKVSHTQNAVKSMPWSRHLILIPCLFALAWLLAALAASQFNSNMLLLDATINVFSIVTTFMVAHKYIENWLYWVVINTASVYLYYQSGLALTAVLFVIYVCFAVYGYWQWLARENTHAS